MLIGAPARRDRARRDGCAHRRGDGGARRVVPADDDDAAVDAQDVDRACRTGRCSVCGGQHLVRACRSPSDRPRQVQDAVDERQHRIDLVGDEHDRGLVLAAAGSRSASLTACWCARVERQQRLVAQQQPRIADQRLRDPQPLLLAARQQPDRRVGVGAARRPPRSRASTLRDARRDRTAGRGGDRRAPKRTRSRPRIGRSRSNVALLRHVADRSWLPRRGARPSIVTVPADSGEQARAGPQQRGLAAAPFGPSTAMNSPGAMSRSRCCPQITWWP